MIQSALDLEIKISLSICCQVFVHVPFHNNKYHSWRLLSDWWVDHCSLGPWMSRVYKANWFSRAQWSTLGRSVEAESRRTEISSLYFEYNLFSYVNGMAPGGTETSLCHQRILQWFWSSWCQFNIKMDNISRVKCGWMGQNCQLIISSVWRRCMGRCGVGCFNWGWWSNN